MLAKCVVGLMDVIDEDVELYYIDNGTSREVSKKNPPASKPDEARVDPVLGEIKWSTWLGLIWSRETHRNQSRSLPPSLEEAERSIGKTTGGDAVLDPKNDDTLQLEKTGMLLWFAFALTFLANFADKILHTFCGFYF